MIYIKPDGGLCNRMRTVDSMISLCEKHDRNLTIIWLSTDNLNCNFHEIFQPIYSKKIKIRIIGSLTLYRLIRLLIKNENFITKTYIQGIYNSNRELKNLSLIEADKKSFSEIEDLTIRLLKKKGQNILIESCYRHTRDNEESYQYFRPIRSIEQKIENKVKEFYNTVGIHIRRTDNKRSIEVSTDDKIFRIINKELQEDSDKTFFLATDCAETKKKYLTAFKGNIITNYDLGYDRAKKKNIQNAVLDLFCLSRTKKIYGSFFSSYSGVAASIGNTEIEIIE